MSNYHTPFLEADTWYTNEFDSHEAYYMTKVNETLSVLLQLQSGMKAEEAIKISGPILMNFISKELQVLQNDLDNCINFILNEKEVSAIDDHNNITLSCIPYREPILFKCGNQERFFSIGRSSILRICYYVPENPTYEAHFPFGDAKAYWALYHSESESIQTGLYCRRHCIDMKRYQISVETLPSPLFLQKDFIVFQGADAHYLIRKGIHFIVKTHLNFLETDINLNEKDWEDMHDAAMRSQGDESEYRLTNAEENATYTIRLNKIEFN